jgi:hypothetical protein
MGFFKNSYNKIREKEDKLVYLSILLLLSSVTKYGGAIGNAAGML